MQLGKCAYTQKTIDIDKLKTNIYNVDHIYPQSYVKDDSITNKVLVISEENGNKGDKYPISKDIREKMQPFWYRLLSNKLISEEKYRRLTRCTSFTEEELTGFINRQLVETHQTTKAVTTVFRTLFPDVEIVYSKAGLVSDFRKEFDMLKTRSVNDLHHAKDAYLNIVVGNVYHCKFTKNFYVTQKYSLKTKTLFTHNVKSGDVMIWNGQDRTDDYTIFLTNIQPNLETISRPVLKIYRYDTLPKTYTTAVISYEFDILFGTKIPMVDYNGVPCNRGDLIEMELMKSLNGQDVAGVGYLQYNHQLSTLDRSRVGIGNNSTFTGYYFIMSTIYTDVGRVDGCNS